MASLSPLSAIETERLRDLRMRLGRPATSEAAMLTLGAACFKLLEQVDVGGGVPLPVETLSVPALVKAAAGADMAMLARLAATLKVHKDREPRAWPAAVAAGAPQALIARRLTLAGREQPAEVPQ